MGISFNNDQDRRDAFNNFIGNMRSVLRVNTDQTVKYW